MHAEVIESLENYLSGTLEPAAQRAIEAHLSSCSGCRDEVHGMQDVSHMFGTLRSEEAWDQLATKIPQTLRRALKLHCGRLVCLCRTS